MMQFDDPKKVAIVSPADGVALAVATAGPIDRSIDPESLVSLF